jgi:hypothetical protein
LLHGSAPEAPDATYLDLQVHARIATRQVADLSHFVIVEGPGRRATHPTACFFPRRTRRKMRALGSPKTPRTDALGQNPANRYVSISRRSVGIAQACHVFPHCNTPQTLTQRHFPTSQFDFFTHSIGRRSPYLDATVSLTKVQLETASIDHQIRLPSTEHLVGSSPTDKSERIPNTETISP